MYLTWAKQHSIDKIVYIPSLHVGQNCHHGPQMDVWDVLSSHALSAALYTCLEMISPNFEFFRCLDLHYTYTIKFVECDVLIKTDIKRAGLGVHDI